MLNFVCLIGLWAPQMRVRIQQRRGCEHFEIQIAFSVLIGSVLILAIFLLRLEDRVAGKNNNH